MKISEITYHEDWGLINVTLLILDGTVFPIFNLVYLDVNLTRS